MLHLTLLSLLAAPQSGFAADETEAYTVEYLKTPAGVALEVGGMDFFSDGRLALCTRRGQVWIVEDPLGVENFADAKLTLFHEGLWEGLGLSIVDDQIHVIQRGELSRLLDLDGDGRCGGRARLGVVLRRDGGVCGAGARRARGARTARVDGARVVGRGGVGCVSGHGAVGLAGRF